MKYIKLTSVLCIVLLGFMSGCGGQPTVAAGPSMAVSETRAEVSWPTRPVTIIVPFPAGGDTDFYARTYAGFLQELLGQTFEVENVSGEAGTYGATQVSSAASDGYTMLFYHTGNMFANVIAGATTLNYNDFAISNIANFDDSFTLIAAARMGITDAADFLQEAKGNRGAFRVAATVPGFTFFALRSIERAGEFSATSVNVAGAGVMAQAMLDGEADFALGPHALFRAGIANGDFVPLMVSAERRNPNFRYVPTVEDMGLSGSAMGSAYFFAFPKGTDSAIVHRLSDTVAQIQFNEAYISAIQDAFDARPFFLPTPAVDEFLQSVWNVMYQMSDYLDN
jgi:tripartite-type tricarboxylate transporter receptor subunit TctC